MRTGEHKLSNLFINGLFSLLRRHDWSDFMEGGLNL